MPDQTSIKHRTKPVTTTKPYETKPVLNTKQNKTSIKHKIKLNQTSYIKSTKNWANLNKSKSTRQNLQQVPTIDFRHIYPGLLAT